jgi:hypothetical protein
LADNHGPLFIGGAGRSGTTLVVDMLGLHPARSPIYETSFVVQIGALLFGAGESPLASRLDRIARYMEEWTRTLPHQPHNKRAHEVYHHGPHYVRFDREFALAQTATLIERAAGGDALAGMRDFVAALFGEHCRIDGKPRWVNKTPSYVQFLPLLGALFPDMRFIHCVRDGRDVACSVLTRPWGPRTYEEAAVWWSRKVRAGLSWSERNPGRCLEVRYEDLLSQPERTLQSMIDFAGEGGDAASLIATYRGATSLDPSRSGRWRAAFDDEDRARFGAVAGDLLGELGYAA